MSRSPIGECRRSELTPVAESRFAQKVPGREARRTGDAGFRVVYNAQINGQPHGPVAWRGRNKRGALAEPQSAMWLADHQGNRRRRP